MDVTKTRAKALDNRGQWFKARTRKTVAEIETKFKTGEVASILYDRIGGLLPAGKSTVHIQVALHTDKVKLDGDEPVWFTEPVSEPDWNVRLGLKELGLKLGKPVPIPPIK
jgi:hypothetical protein